MRGVLKGLRPRATAHLIEGADHAFHVPVRGGRNDREIAAEIAVCVAGWTGKVGG
jgi:hypothetical protein